MTYRNTLNSEVAPRVPDLPILGEPLIPELANTLYVDQAGSLDFFAKTSWAAAWMTTAPSALEASAPHRLTAGDLVRLRALRDAVRSVLLSDESRTVSAAVDTVNRTMHQAKSQKFLVVLDTGEFSVATATGASRADAFLAAVATRLIETVESDQLRLITVCDRPDCNMLYFRHHHRRRYCNDRCASADRQARYNNRRLLKHRSNPTGPRTEGT